MAEQIDSLERGRLISVKLDQLATLLTEQPPDRVSLLARLLQATSPATTGADNASQDHENHGRNQTPQVRQLAPTAAENDANRLPAGGNPGQ